MSEEALGALVLGIDFGTSNSCVSIWRPDKRRPKVIKNLQTPGNKITPSTITFPHLGFVDRRIGETSSAPNTVRGVKNVLGLTVKELQGLTPGTYPTCNVTDMEEKDAVDVVCLDVDGNRRLFDPADLVSCVLTYLRDCARDYLRRKPIKARNGQVLYASDPLNRVVVGVPAQFAECRRLALRQAAEAAGFDEIHFLVESTAAAMAYGLLVAGDKTVLVFDIGGGTTDVTILRIRDGTHRVEFTGGFSQLGGQHIDVLVRDHVLSRLALTEAQLAPDDRRRLLDACRQCKEALTSEETFTIDVAFLATAASTAAAATNSAADAAVAPLVPAATLVVTRDELETLLQPLCRTVTESLLQIWRHWDAAAALDEVVVVGGSSRVPCVQRAVHAAWQRGTAERLAPSLTKELCTAVHPEHAVAEGLAIRGAVLSGCIDTDTDSDTDTDAGGASSSASVVTKLRQWLMLDCVPQTIGIIAHDAETHERFFEPLIARGRSLPCAARHRLQLQPLQPSSSSTSSHRQRRRLVTLEIYEEVEDYQCRLAADENVWYRDATADVTADVTADATADANATADAASGATVHYSYHLLRMVDVAVDASLVAREGDDSDEAAAAAAATAFVVVVFDVDADGVLHYRVERDDGGASAASATAATVTTTTATKTRDESDATTWLLSALAVLLVAVYLAVKLALPVAGRYDAADAT